MRKIARKRGRIDEVIDAWWRFRDKPYVNWSGSVYFDSHKVIYSFGEHFPLGARIEGGVLRNVDRYSVTTACHQTQFAGGWRNRGKHKFVNVSFNTLKWMDLDYPKMEALDMLSEEYDSDYDCLSRIDAAQTYQNAKAKYGDFAKVNSGYSDYNSTQWVSIRVKPHALLKQDDRYILAGNGVAYWLYWLVELSRPDAGVHEYVTLL